MSDKKIRVSVVGATGYGGAEVTRLLLSHPFVEIASVTSGRNPGKRLRDECAWLDTDLVLSAFTPEKADADITMLCQDAGFAMEHVATLLPQTRVIDFSADFRLKNLETYQTYYRREHTAPTISAVYGLPELGDRTEIASARLIANPGCYPTASALAIHPLVKAGLITGTPVIDAKSGVSGAGRSRKETEYLFSEINGGFKAYGVIGHRHTPEIEQILGLPVRFTPHLIPVARGIEVTAHAPVSTTTRADLVEIYHAAYANEPFVKIVDAPPSTKQVLGTNRCDIYVDYDARTGHAVVLSVIDNLVKGMAGQAIQSMNLMMGLPETTGLPRHAVWP